MGHHGSSLFLPFFFFFFNQTQEKPHVCTLSSPRDGLRLWEQMWVGSHVAIKGPYYPVALGLVSREAAKLNCLKKDPQPVGPPSFDAGLGRGMGEVVRAPAVLGLGVLAGA